MSGASSKDRIGRNGVRKPLTHTERSDPKGREAWQIQGTDRAIVFDER